MVLNPTSRWSYAPIGIYAPQLTATKRSVLKRATSSEKLSAQPPIPDVPRLVGASRGRLVVVQLAVVDREVCRGEEVVARKVLDHVLVDDVEGRLPRGWVRCRELE